jgi:uncharacterized protein YcbX
MMKIAIGEIVTLFRYPLKSMAGERLVSARRPGWASCRPSGPW